MDPIGTATAAGDALPDNLSSVDNDTNNLDVSNPAKTLIENATDPVTGQIDTRALADMVVDASRTDFELADAAYAQIAAELAAINPADSAHFSKQVVEIASNFVPGTTITGATHGVLAAGTKTLINNPILAVSWVATRSAWTGQGGWRNSMTKLFDANGISYTNRVYAPPLGSVGTNSGHSPGRANNINGHLAENAIAARYQAAGYTIEQQVKVQGGKRVIDVVATRTNADPRYNERIELESKATRKSPGKMEVRQTTLDGERVSNNKVMRRAGELLERVGKVARPIGLVMDAIEVGQAVRADGNTVGTNTSRAMSGLTGGVVGGYGGALTGAAIGTAIFPGVGTVVGGIIGGVGGAFVGDTAGRGVFDSVRSWF